MAYGVHLPSDVTLPKWKTQEAHQPKRTRRQLGDLRRKHQPQKRRELSARPKRSLRSGGDYMTHHLWQPFLHSRIEGIITRKTNAKATQAACAISMVPFKMMP